MTCRSLFTQLIAFALALARDKAGNSNAARIAMMAMTTSNSINVKARKLFSALLKPTIGFSDGHLPERFQLLKSQIYAKSIVCRSALLHPVPVGFVGAGMIGGLSEPFVNFGVPIRKGETACTAVIRAGRIHPFGNFHAKGKRRVIQAVGIFIHKNPKH